MRLAHADKDRIESDFSVTFYRAFNDVVEPDLGAFYACQRDGRRISLLVDPRHDRFFRSRLSLETLIALVTLVTLVADSTLCADVALISLEPLVAYHRRRITLKALRALGTVRTLESLVALLTGDVADAVRAG